MDEKMDVIVVGGGLAGLTAAYVMAEAGLAVLLIERGTYCGAKNVTGGKLCAHSIEKVFPNFAQEAPYERRIVREAVFQWDGDELISMGKPDIEGAYPESVSYTVLRAKLDAWLAEKVEEAGAMIVNNICVTGLIVRDGRVCGVKMDDEEMEANVVVLADGINSLLGQSIGLTKELKAEETCVGCKEIIGLDEETINKRFGLSGDEGIEFMFMSDESSGRCFDGFIYTNKDSLSVGIEFRIDKIYNTELSVPDMLEVFKDSKGVNELISGGTLNEYSAHLVHHGGAERLEKLYGDGVVVAGDAAGLTANFGFSVRGMDLAVESGRLAAEAIVKAHEDGDFSAEELSGYQKMVEESFIAKDMYACCRYFKEAKGE